MLLLEFSIRTSLNPEQSREKLRELVAPPFNPFRGVWWQKNKKYVGHIRQTGFTIWPNVHFATNPPKISGTICPTEAGTEINFEVKRDPGIALFSLFCVVGMSTGLWWSLRHTLHILLPIFFVGGIFFAVFSHWMFTFASKGTAENARMVFVRLFATLPEDND